MVLLIKKQRKFPLKFNHKLAEIESIASKSFQSLLSEGLNDLLNEQNYGSCLSLSWYIPCFNFLQGITRAFVKLVKDLNYPYENWEGNLIEDYLSYTLNLLDTLNSISSSISHLGISRLTLIHAISLIHNSPSLVLEHLKPIKPRKIEALNCKKSCARSFNCEKERVVCEAMMKMKEVELVILRVLLYGLSEVNGGDFECFEFKDLSLRFSERLVVKEIVKVNEAVKDIEAGLIEGKKSSKNDLLAEELKKMLGELENLLELVNKEVNCLFSDVLARRNEVIDSIRLSKSNS